MRLAAPIVAALLLAGLASACAEEKQQAPATLKLWQTGTRAPTVTLTEPAGGPTRERR